MKCFSYLRPGKLPFVLSVAAALSSAVAVNAAEVVFVTALASNCTTCTTVNSDVNQEWMSVYEEGISGANTTAKSTAQGKPATYGSRYFSNSFSNSTPDLGITIAPSLSVTGGVYRLFHTFNNSAGNVSTNIVLGITNVKNATISVDQTDKFQRVYGTNAWQLIGYVTNAMDSATPYIRFYYKDGVVSAAASQRLIIDTFRFTLVEPCVDVPTVSVVGPLSSATNVVAVSGVSANAQRIVVYQDSGSGRVQIGEKTTGVVAGLNEVTVVGLLKDATVTANQVIGGIEGCLPTTGIVVGGGANPPVRVVLNIRENLNLTGPVWAPGSGGILYYIGATAGTSYPEDARTINPANEWQTVTFDRTTDPVFSWFGADADATLDGDFGALDGIGFASSGFDTGPYDIYIDDISNGTHGVVQDFEGVAEGTAAYQFVNPGVSGTTSGNVLSRPNQSVITSATQFSGRNALRLRFQFNSVDASKWVRIVTSGAGGVANPQVDLNQPISFKMLLLPVGVEPVSKVPGRISFNREGNNLVLTWNGNFQLQSAQSPAGPWTSVSGVTAAPYNAPISGSAMFYRLVSSIQ